MKKFIAALLVIFSLSGQALAADEFGPRFTNTAPGALEDSGLDLLAEGQDLLQDIEPAAGNQTPDLPPETPQNTPNSSEKLPAEWPADMNVTPKFTSEPLPVTDAQP
ncbi:MAG: hypothetical protein IT559_08315 [Alphaproteobacteria bacterium]|nr:hypothetical protein [Alphaproteobacteria bacterium]